MKIAGMLLVVALAMTSASAQLATGIRLVDVRFSGDTQVEGVDLRSCATELG